MSNISETDAKHQALASGTLGATLLAIEQAHAGIGAWSRADEFVRLIAAGNIDAGDHAGLYYGLPAFSFVLDTGGDRYQHLAAGLDKHLQRLVHKRLAIASARNASRQATSFAEFDLFYGLVGIGVLLMRRMPQSDLMAEVLRYVINLTEPQLNDGVTAPGWWVAHDPDPLLPTPGGHANFGMAHGAAGMLAFLAITMRRGITVEGQSTAIERLVAWFHMWKQVDKNGTWWPQWLTRDELASGQTISQPGKPSWCYGTTGIARALQLSAIALDDRKGRVAAEDILANCFTKENLSRLVEPGICHGIAGVRQTAFRAAQDTALAARAPTLPELPFETITSDDGFLTGSAGLQLASMTAHENRPPHSGWDTCLLLA